MQKITLFVFWAILMCTFCSRQIEDLMKVKIVVDQNTGMILYTSKPLNDRVSEDSLVEVKLRAGEEEEYLIVEEDGTVESVLVKAKYPFMEGQVKEQLELKESTRVFRVLDIQQFQSMIPRIVLLSVLLVIQLGLWICFGICGQKGKKSANIVDWKRWLIKNKGCLVIGAIIIIFTWIFAKVIVSIDLPSSLLPTENIFDWKYYVSEFKYFK